MLIGIHNNLHIRTMDLSEEVIDNNVLYMKSLVGKRVRVQTVENDYFEGIVYVIDPIYKTIVLCDDNKIRIFIYLSIKTLDVPPGEVEEKSFLQEPQPKDIGDWKNIGERKEKLHKWLKHMFINVQEEGEILKVEEHLLIGPPYTQETCYCDNTIILERIRNIMNSMPDNFE